MSLFESLAWAEHFVFSLAYLTWSMITAYELIIAKADSESCAAV
jgi:hypothetical protein